MISADSEWSQNIYSDFINGTLENLTINETGFSSNLQIDLSEFNEWQEVSPPSNPKKRDTNRMAAIYGTDKVMLYLDFIFNDTWIYDMSDNTWTNNNIEPKPSARYYCAISTIFGDDKVVLFGGGSGNSTGTFNDTWVYDLSDNKWTKKNPVVSPEGRIFFDMENIYGTDKVLLFGGSLGGIQGLANDTWIYDLSNDTWTKMYPSNVPELRQLNKLCSIWNTDKILMFGGDVKDQPYYDNETWIYDLSENNWTKLNISKRPCGRYGHSMATILGTDRILLFGGKGDYQYNDTWIFDYSNQTWTQVILLNQSNRPEKRLMHDMTHVYGTDKIILFGGILPSGKKVNDTWVFEYSLPTKNGTFISKCYDTVANSSFKLLNWSAMMPANTSVKFQLRTGKTEDSIETKDFIGIDGTSSSYYSNYPSEIWLGHYGDRWIQCKAYLNMSIFTDSPRLSCFSIEYNNLPEVKNLTPIDNSFLITNKPEFKWEFRDLDSSYQKSFQILIDDDLNFQSIEFDSGEQSTSGNSWRFPENTSYDILSEATWYWKIKLKDSDGDWGFYSTPFMFTMDTGIPSSKIIIPKNNTYYRELEIIYGTAFEPPNGTGLDKIELQIEDLDNQKFWDGSDFNSIVSWLIPDGKEIWSYDVSNIEWTSGTTYKIRSRAVDIAGNIESPVQKKEFIFDDEGVMFFDPIPEIYQISNQEKVQVGITISDNTSGVNSSTIKYSTSTNAGTIWSSWKTVEGYSNGNSVNVKLNLTFPNGTGNRIQWRASDIAGNGPTYSVEYIVNVNIVQELILPEIQLLAPENNSVIKTTSIELNWDILKLGSKKAKFDIYFDTDKPPMVVVQENHTELSLIINDLEDGYTYYWSVVPKIDGQFGTCISGVWSFSVKIPTQTLPKVNLKTPANGSTIQSVMPTLVWELEYEGEAKIDYTLYLGTSPNPGLRMDKVPATYFSITEQLSDNTTYYWYVVPYASGLTGVSSEIWSFTVKLNEDNIPKFGIELVLNPNPLEIKPGEVKFVSAIVTNLGELTDNFTVTIGDVNNSKLTAENYRQDTLEIEPGMNKEFLIMISLEENTKPGFENITIIAKSKLVEKYNLEIQDNQVLTIKILEKENQKEKERGQPISIFYFSILLLIIILIIISVIILFILRKKSSKKESEVVESQDIITETGELIENITTPEPEPTVEPLPVVTQQQDETLEE